MSIEEEIFKKAIPDFKKLELYGFEKSKESYIYSKLILKDSFKLYVEIDNNQSVKCKVIDLTFNDEYTNYKNKNISSEFVNTVRKEIEEILEDIKLKCFKINYFESSQANKIANLIIKKYQNTPEFLWDKYPCYGIFRNSISKKWYAIIMNVQKNRIDDKYKKEDIEIINVKLDKEEIDKLLSKKGFYKAYHMNKKSWITIILDDTLSDEEIMSYVIKSYGFSKN